MPKPLSLVRKRVGRPPTGMAPSLTFRCPSNLIGKLDTWIAALPPPQPSRSEALRRILAQVLGGDAGSVPAEDMNASNDE